VRGDLCAQHVVPSYRTRQRLDQRRVLGAHVLGQRHAVRDRRDRVLRRAAGCGHPDRLPPLAQVVAAVPTVVALVAVQGRVHRHPVADAALGDVVSDRHHLTGELVAGDDRQRRRELAGQDVQVGTAEPAPGDGHHDVSRAGRRVVERGDLDLAGSADHGGSHWTSAPQVAR
jgi:hypothetical protein